MNNCEIEFANLNINWRFPFMASQLPIPGSEAFEILVKGLRPFEITARSLNIESPSSNLDDVAITVSLIAPRLNLRIAYSGFEIDVRDVEEEEINQILEIVSTTFQSIEKVNSEAKNGSGTIKISLHLKLLDKSVSEFIAERTYINLNGLTVKPEATVFSLNIDEVTNQYPTKVTIAESLAVKNGLFLDIAYQNKTIAKEGSKKDPLEFFGRIAEHYHTIFSLLELNPILEEENEQ